MSEIIKDRAVVLKTYGYGESSLVAVLLTRSHGKMRFLAKGARSAASPFLGSLGTGTTCEIVFHHRADRGLQVIKEIFATASFEAAGGDLERLCLFQAALELVDRSVVEREADERVFDTMETFTSLLPSAGDPWAVFFALEIGILKMAGSFPSTATCGICRAALDGEAFALDASSGLVSCCACAGPGGRTLSARASSLLSRVERSGFEGVREARLERAERKEIGELIHRLFMSHVDGYRLPYALRLCKGVNGQ